MKQRKIFKNWFGLYRYFYNKCIDYCKENGIFEKEEECSAFRLNKAFRNQESEDKEYILPEWCNFQAVPRFITGALGDFSKAYKGCLALKKNGKIKDFEMKFKSKKDPFQTLYMEQSCFGKGNVLLPRYEPKIGRLKTFRRKIIKFEKLVINHDVRLQLTPDNKYYLIVVFDSNCNENKVKVRTDNKGYSIGLDPGVRTFVTGYSPEGQLFEIGKDSFKRILKMLKEGDIIRGKIDKKYKEGKITSDKKKRSLRRALLKKYRKIRNLVDEIHWKTVNYLSGFEKIYYGNIMISSLLKSTKCYKRTKRLLCAFRFYDFKMKLKERCSDKLVIVNESWTSKTCSSCGFIKHDLGTDEVYNCNRCKISIPRDINGAKNILVKGTLMAAMPS